jgi:hypothetical protein
MMSAAAPGRPPRFTNFPAKQRATITLSQSPRNRRPAFFAGAVGGFDEGHRSEGIFN